MFSAVSPIDSLPNFSFSPGLGKRQPIVVSHIVTLPQAKAASALGTAQGARDIDSTPPAINTSPSPTLIARAAALIAFRLEAQSRLKVTAATDVGSPARSAAIRATLRLSSPAWLAHPK